MRTYVQTKGDIGGLQAVSDAVKAVEMVAASHIHRLRKAALSLEEYVIELRQMLGEFTSYHAIGDNPLLRRKTDGEAMLIVVIGDRGLVGGLYNEIISELGRIRGRYGRIIVVGGRGDRLMREEGMRPERTLPAPSDLMTGAESAAISDFALTEFEGGRARSVDVLYSKFVTLAVQRPHVSAFLPFEMGDVPAADAEPGIPIFEPSKRHVADELLRRYIGMFFSAILSEAKLSEFAARTVAMEHAGSQADDEVRKVTLRYFKERRRDISRKQIESFFAHKAL